MFAPSNMPLLDKIISYLLICSKCICHNWVASIFNNSDDKKIATVSINILPNK